MMAIILGQALEQMIALLPLGGKLEELTEAVMNVPFPAWAKIQADKDIINRWQAMGFHKNDIKALRKEVMTMPKSHQTLATNPPLNEDEEYTGDLVPTVIHPNEVSQQGCFFILFLIYLFLILIHISWTVSSC
jgi:hypothetical protein